MTARKVAEESGCSSQLVFRHFPSIQRLREEAFQSICHGWMQDFKTWKDRPDYVAAIVLWVVNLARTWPCLYQTLFFPGNTGQVIFCNFKKSGDNFRFASIRSILLSIGKRNLPRHFDTGLFFASGYNGLYSGWWKFTFYRSTDSVYNAVFG